MAGAKYWNTGVRTGGRVVVELDGIAIAFAQSARFRDDYGLEPVHIIGQLQTIEYVPMHARHEIQMAVLVVNKNSLSRMGLEPATAGSFGVYGDGKQIGDGIVKRTPSAEKWDDEYGWGRKYNSKISKADSQTDGAADFNIYTVLHAKVFDIKVYDAEPSTENTFKKGYNGDTGSGRLIHYENCFFAGGDMSIDANRTLVHNVTFYAQNKNLEGSSLQNRNDFWSK